MIEEIKQSNIIEYIKKMPMEDRIAINNELCNLEKSDSMYLLEHNKALVEALEQINETIHGYVETKNHIGYQLNEIEGIAKNALTTYKGENTHGKHD